jgi:elongation factor 2
MYCAKFKIEEPKMMKRLWGDNFFNEKEKKWTKSCTDDMTPLKCRGFNKYILVPIYQVRKMFIN